MDIKQFLDSGYTAFHVVDNVCAMLEEAGFCRLGSNWQLQRGGKYYTTQNGSSVVAFRIGQKDLFNIVESHTDSPSFKVKEGLLASGSVYRLNTERYGGGLVYTFLDRPLKLAGRVLQEKDGALVAKTVTSAHNFVIPSLAIHHNPKANEGISFNLQKETLPLFSQGQASVQEALQCGPFVDADLFVVPATPAFFAGAEEEFLCSPRLDNLTSVFASVQALVQCQPQNIALVACLDNEEIGSGTLQGSPEFLRQTVAKIQQSLGFSVQQCAASTQQGMVLSADNGHALHPNYPEKSDPVSHAVLNGGIVVKHHSNYATDGKTAAIFKLLMQKHNVPTQDSYNRSDVRCGSTLGLATARTLQMCTCDIGLAQLAMHSACETVGAKDIAAMQKAMQVFLSAAVCVGEDKCTVE